MNVWPVDETAASWAGTFSYAGQPLHGVYDWIRYTAGEDCTMTPPPVSPPPPDGDSAFMHVGSIELGLGKRGDQVIAHVSVENGTGSPVAGATVNGTWSGVISNGDGTRTTDADGVATFYSGRSRSAGGVTFCVTGVSGANMSYEPSANFETCDTISK